MTSSFVMISTPGDFTVGSYSPSPPSIVCSQRVHLVVMVTYSLTSPPWWCCQVTRVIILTVWRGGQQIAGGWKTWAPTAHLPLAAIIIFFLDVVEIKRCLSPLKLWWCVVKLYTIRLFARWPFHKFNWSRFSILPVSGNSSHWWRLKSCIEDLHYL